MRAKTKGHNISFIVGLLPVLLALIPYTILWYIVHGDISISFDVMNNLEWVIIFLVCWRVSLAFLNLIVGYVMN